MTEYYIEPCNSLKREALFFGIPQTLFFLFIGVVVMFYLIYNIVSAFGNTKLTIGLVLVESTISLVSFFYLKSKGPNLIISEIQKNFVFLSRPHWIKAK